MPSGGGKASLRKDDNGEVSFADVLDALVQNSYKVTDLAAEAQVSHSSKQCRN